MKINFPHILLFLILIAFLSSCSFTRSSKHEKRDFWIDNRYRSLSYIDTNEINKQAITFIVNGAAARAKNDLNAAIIEFMLALQYDSSAAIYYAIAECFLWQNRHDLAIRYGHKALKKEPNLLPVYEVLVRAYISNNDLTNAVISWENYVQLAEDDYSIDVSLLLKSFCKIRFFIKNIIIYYD